MAARASKETYIEQLSDELVFGVSQRWLEAQDDSTITTDIARWLNENHADELKWLQPGQRAKTMVDKTRSKVYRIVREGVRRKFIRLNPPEHVQKAELIRQRYRIDDKARTIKVVNVHGTGVRDQVAYVGAEVTLALIKQLGKKKERVRIGLGAGRTAMTVARRLGQLVGSEAECPKLALHALTSGFTVNPMTAPVTFFRFFDEAKVDVEYVGLFAAATANYENYDDVKQQPVVDEAFHWAADIDIVITSLARADDEHGMLNGFLTHGPRQMVSELRAKKWVGDVQFLPYSPAGPITLSKGFRAVTLFELSDLVRMARTEDKFVVLVAGPCNQCPKLKTKALRPLLEQESLRVWSHMVTDIGTAEWLLKDEDPD